MNDDTLTGSWELINQRFTSPGQTKQAHLFHGFQLLDYYHKGYLIEDDFIAISHAIHHSLVFVDISSPVFTYEQFGRTLYNVLANGKNRITLPEYIEAIDVSKFVFFLSGVKYNDIMYFTISILNFIFSFDQLVLCKKDIFVNIFSSLKRSFTCKRNNFLLFYFYF